MTIRLRLTIYWAAVLAAIVLVAAISALQLFARQQWSAMDAALLEEAENTADQIQHSRLSAVQGILQRLSLETDIGPGRRVRIATAHGAIDDFGDSRTIPPPFDTSLPTHPKIVGDRAVRFAIVPIMLGGDLAYLQSGVQGGLIRASVANLRNLLLLMVPIVLVLCVGGGYVLAGRALRPIESVTAELDAIGPSNLSSRLTVPPAEDEVARLTKVINALIERLERASATERRFASDAAHELRTPLAVLRTGLEVALARDRTTEENRVALGEAHREALSLCRIADELLMLSRLNGEVMVDRHRLNLRGLIGEIAATVGPLAQAHEIKLTVHALEDVFVNGNEGHLRRLIVNLLDNALKFTPAGGSIDVGLKSDANRAIVRVADTGAGIHPAELPHIFDRFFRGAGSPGEGSGLGLSLCREIARAHGGDIAAANLPQGG
ncbi:MAG TPA: ATP-binding protein, partial [Candidatus Binatus sp.]|nr:ATP-binding protein [Candidatus Binatus sp.]